MRVEQLDFIIQWRKFQVGSSFFIPCLNPTTAWKRVNRAVKKHGFIAIHKVVIEDGVRGIRVWRVAS